jgi:hypothetical protein
MANGKRTTLEGLGDAIAKELTIYDENLTERINNLSAQAAKDLVTKTRATAPVGFRGSFKKNIAWKRVGKSWRSSKYAWYVKAPDYRLTHLLVHGHETRDGGRTRPDPFLANALAEVLPDYEKDVEEACKNG